MRGKSILLAISLGLLTLSAAAQERSTDARHSPAGSGASGGPVGFADLAIVNAKVWTVDAKAPKAEAVAVFGTRIVAVGSNTEIRKLIGGRTRTIDARGKSVLPGFVDAHVHFSDGGFGLSGVNLKDAATREEFVRRIAEFAKT